MTQQKMTKKQQVQEMERQNKEEGRRVNAEKAKALLAKELEEARKNLAKERKRLEALSDKKGKKEVRTNVEKARLDALEAAYNEQYKKYMIAERKYRGLGGR